MSDLSQDCDSWPCEALWMDHHTPLDISKALHFLQKKMVEELLAWALMKKQLAESKSLSIQKKNDNVMFSVEGKKVQ